MNFGQLTIDLLLTLGLLLAGPIFLICIVQSVRWLVVTETHIKPEVRLKDLHLGLLAVFGPSAVLFHREVLTEKGVQARANTLAWLRRLLLTSCVLAALVLVKETVHPEPMPKRGQSIPVLIASLDDERLLMRLI